MKHTKHSPALKKFLRKLWRFLISNVGAFVIGFSALAIAIYQYAVNRPILEYATNSQNFISSENENKFKVLVENKEYEDLYQTIVILKNTGQQPLDGRDVSELGHDPIRIIVPPESEMVHFTLDKTLTSEDVTAHVQLYRGNIVISFDYLNPDDQIAVTILHEKSCADFYVTGRALGVTTIRPEWTDGELLRLTLWGFIGLYLLTLFLEYLDRKGVL